MNTTRKTWWIEISADRTPDVGDLIWADVQDGRSQVEVVEIGAHWSRPVNGQSGYQVRVRELSTIPTSQPERR